MTYLPWNFSPFTVSTPWMVWFSAISPLTSVLGRKVILPLRYFAHSLQGFEAFVGAHVADFLLDKL